MQNHVDVRGGVIPKRTTIIKGSLAGAAKLQKRAKELNNRRRGFDPELGTTAVIRAQNKATGKIETFIGVNGRGPQPKQWKLRPGEKFIRAKGDAEEGILNTIKDTHILIEGSASRNVRRARYAPLIESLGGKLGGPTFRGREDKTRFRMFFRE